MKKQRVLILCTGNSCRSQMAEGLINRLLAAEWEAFSAGSAPAGYVHPLAIRAMAELGIDISQGQSEAVAAYRSLQPDLVVTVCDSAAQNCPVWLGEGEVVHIPFTDPAEAEGSVDEQMAVYRLVRDQIRAGLLPVLQERTSQSGRG